MRILCSKSFVKALKDSLPAGLWDQFLFHPFVRGMADGTLPRECFEYYIKQDYLYLQHYARSASLAAYKCKPPFFLEVAIVAFSNDRFL